MLKNRYPRIRFQTRVYDRIHRLYMISIYVIIFIFMMNSLAPVTQVRIITPAAAEVDSEVLGSGPGRFNSIVADDIDDDGRYEIVFGNYEGYVTVLERRGDDFYEEWRSPKIGHRVWGITIADFVGDSTKEIIVGNGDGEIYIYDAKTHKQVWHVEDLVRDVHGLLVHDLGQPGVKYLLAGTGYKTDNDLGTVYIFKSESGKINLTSKIGQFENRQRGIGVGDVDKDGSLEIVVGSGVTTGERPGEGYIRVYNIDKALDPNTLNSDTPIEPEWKSENLKGCCVALELADFTGDGYPDIVVGCGYRYQAGWIKILTYDTESKDFTLLWKSPDEPDIGPKPYGLAIGDIDDDDQLEIVVGNLAGYIYIFEQTSSGIQQEWKSKMLGSDIFGIDIADVDDDGTIEIIASQGGYTGKGDYTSGYTEPHIYIINGKTHKIENTIGETSPLETILTILVLILFITFLIGLNYFARMRKRLKELQAESKPSSTRPPTKAVPTSTTTTTTTTQKPLSKPVPERATAKSASTVSTTPTPQDPTAILTQPKPQPQPSPPPQVNDPFPPSEVNDPFPPPQVNDPFPPSTQSTTTKTQPQKQNTREAK